jgi:hypothetical protein
VAGRLRAGLRYDSPRDLGDGWRLVGEVQDRSAARHALVAVHDDGRAKVKWAAGKSGEG